MNCLINYKGAEEGPTKQDTKMVSIAMKSVTWKDMKQMQSQTLQECVGQIKSN
jgi:hypothetical protein